MKCRGTTEYQGNHAQLNGGLDLIIFSTNHGFYGCNYQTVLNYAEAAAPYCNHFNS